MKIANYKDYLQTPHWKRFSADARKHYRFKCYVCGGRGWHVNHLHYYKDGKSILFNETFADVRLLCEKDHLRGKQDLQKLDQLKATRRWQWWIELVPRLAWKLTKRLLRVQ